MQGGHRAWFGQVVWKAIYVPPHQSPMKDVRIGSRNVSVERTVDAVGLFCPMPVVRLKLALEKVEVNQVVELLADDPGVSSDLPAWCEETGNQLLSLEKSEEGLFV